MRRRLTEQPRVVIAQIVLVAALVVAGVGLGAGVADEGDEVPPGTAQALERARSAAHTSRRALDDALAERDRLRARFARERRRATALSRRNRALRRSLDRTRRRLLRARRR